eukprot:PITA_09109
MAAGNRRVSAASARAHTRKGKSGSRSAISVWKKLAFVSIVGFLAWAYKAIQPPPPIICGTPNGPPVTAPRIHLQDGRHLAYKESGVPKERAKSVRSAALAIEGLADQLDLGPKFYVIGISMGGYPTWGCLRYIPHRLAGVALLAPTINYRWPGFPANLSKKAYYQQPLQEQWALTVSYYTPWLTYWWMSQKWLPSSRLIQGTWKPLNRHDRELIIKFAASGKSAERVKATLQQGVFESLHREMMIMFGKWDFDPMELSNPSPNNVVPVHIWQGDEDELVPASLQHYIAERLSWIHYHEIPEAGHLFVLMEGVPSRILRSLLFGEESPNSVN